MPDFPASVSKYNFLFVEDSFVFSNQRTDNTEGTNLQENPEGPGNNMPHQ